MNITINYLPAVFKFTFVFHEIVYRYNWMLKDLFPYTSNYSYHITPAKYQHYGKFNRKFEQCFNGKEATSILFSLSKKGGF